jgi:hypothetical protein
MKTRSVAEHSASENNAYNDRDIILAFKLKLLKLDNNKYCQGYLLLYFVSQMQVRPEFKIDDHLGL